MEMLEIHASALTTGNVPYHEFLLCYKAAERFVYGFVEGREDPCFYRGFIDAVLPDGWRVKLIRAGSKKRVIAAYESMDWSRFPPKRICFFVDRDLSDFLEIKTPTGDNLYITDKYSIDSEIVSARVFERILVEILGFTDLNHDETAKIENVFEANLTLFQEIMSPVMAQIIIWRKSGASVYLDNIDLKKLVAFHDCTVKPLERFKSSYELVEQAAVMAGTTISPWEDIVAHEKEFKSKQGPHKLTRGKYLVWFLVQLAKAIHQSASTFCQKLTGSPKACLDLSSSNFVAIAAPRSRCPASLSEFLQNNFVQFTKEAIA